MANESRVKRNFIVQQGLPEPATESCPLQYSALLFQPRIVGLVVLLGVLLKSTMIFFGLAGVLWWSALLPDLNPFDAIYNRSVAGESGHIALSSAPAPRRFAQGMAGGFALAIGASLLYERWVMAIALQVLLLLAVGALVFGSFCSGSFVFHLIRRRLAFAKRTLPWSGLR